MDDNQDNKPKLVPANRPLAAAPSPLLTETFEIQSNPPIDEIIRTMARLSNFCNLLCAEALRSRVVSAANPSTMAMMNAAANLEQGAMAQRQEMAMKAAQAGGQFVGPGQGQCGQGGQGSPFRMN
jgi:hypothetical protein